MARMWQLGFKSSRPLLVCYSTLNFQQQFPKKQFPKQTAIMVKNREVSTEKLVPSFVSLYHHVWLNFQQLFFFFFSCQFYSIAVDTVLEFSHSLLRLSSHLGFWLLICVGNYHSILAIYELKWFSYWNSSSRSLQCFLLFNSQNAQVDTSNFLAA